MFCYYGNLEDLMLPLNESIGLCVIHWCSKWTPISSLKTHFQILVPLCWLAGELQSEICVFRKNMATVVAEVSCMSEASIHLVALSMHTRIYFAWEEYVLLWVINGDNDLTISLCSFNQLEGSRNGTTINLV